MAVERVREGEPSSSVIASHGFCRTTIYKWPGVASRPGIGRQAPRSTKAAGKPRTLSPRQEQQVFGRSMARTPASMASISGSGRVPSWPV
jgi:hypothetical protein